MQTRASILRKLAMCGVGVLAALRSRRVGPAFHQHPAFGVRGQPEVAGVAFSFGLDRCAVGVGGESVARLGVVADVPRGLGTARWDLAPGVPALGAVGP